MQRLFSRLLSRRLLFLAVAICMATASYLLFFEFRSDFLVIEIPATGEIAWAAPFKSGEQFQLSYIHSVDLLPVIDTYTCEGRQLVLMETRFLSWGAGLGYMGEGILSEENGWTVIKEMQRQVGTLPLRVGTIAEQAILYRGTEVRLRDYLPAQALVHIRVKRSIFLNILREAKK